jgi:hypothetical protein
MAGIVSAQEIFGQDANKLRSPLSNSHGRLIRKGAQATHMAKTMRFAGYRTGTDYYVFPLV